MSKLKKVELVAAAGKVRTPAAATAFVAKCERMAGGPESLPAWFRGLNKAGERRFTQEQVRALEWAWGRARQLAEDRPGPPP